MAEGFGYPSLSSVSGGRLAVEYPKDSGENRSIQLGRMAVGTFHTVWHWVEKAVRATPLSPQEKDDGIRGALIFQNYNNTILVADALRSNPSAEIIDQKANPTRVEDLVLAGKIKMTTCEWKRVKGGAPRKGKWVPRQVDGRYVAASKLPINMNKRDFEKWYKAQKDKIAAPVNEMELGKRKGVDVYFFGGKRMRVPNLH